MQLRRAHVGMIAAGVAVVAALVVVIVVVITRDDHGRRPDYVVGPSETSAGSGSDLEWSADGTRLYVVDGGGIDVLSGEPLAVTDRIEWARAGQIATWNTDRSMVALSSSEPGVELWDVASGRELPSIDTGTVEAILAWSPDGEAIAVAGDPGEVITFDARTGEELDRFVIFDGPIEVLGLTWPRDDRLVAVSYNHTTAIDPTTGEVVWSHAARPRGLIVASGAADAVADGEGRVFALEDGDEIGRLDVVSYIKSIDWSPDGEWVIVSGDDDQPQLWATDEAATRRGYTELGPYDAGASWSPDSQRALIPDRYDRRLVVIDVEADDDGTELSIAEDVTIADTAWSPAGDRAAAVGGDHLIFVWAMEAED